MQNLIQKTLGKMKKKYNPTAIILYGSRSVGDFSAKSDIDLAIFADVTEAFNDNGEVDGVQLDAWIYPNEILECLDNEYLRFFTGQVLLDQDSKAKNYIKSIQQKLKVGPTPLTENKKIHIKQWVFKMIARSEEDNMEGIYRRMWIQTELLSVYFNLRDQWFLGSKYAFKCLQENDKVAFDLFQLVYMNPNDLKALNQLAQYVVEVH